MTMGIFRHITDGTAVHRGTGYKIDAKLTSRMSFIIEKGASLAERQDGRGDGSDEPRLTWA